MTLITRNLARQEKLTSFSNGIFHSLSHLIFPFLIPYIITIKKTCSDRSYIHRILYFSIFSGQHPEKDQRTYRYERICSNASQTGAKTNDIELNDIGDNTEFS